MNPDEDEPVATLGAVDEAGEPLARVLVAPAFKLTRASGTVWVESGFRKLR